MTENVSGCFFLNTVHILQAFQLICDKLAITFNDLNGY